MLCPYSPAGLSWFSKQSSPLGRISADRLGRAVVNSETFLMTNMSPQKPGFNRDVWKQLEQAVRNLAAQEKYVEVYAICGPLFKIGDPIEVIGENHVVVPDAFFKSVLAEEKRSGRLRMWSFAIANEKTDKDPSDFFGSHRRSRAQDGAVSLGPLTREQER